MADLLGWSKDKITGLVEMNPSPVFEAAWTEEE